MTPFELVGEQMSALENLTRGEAVDAEIKDIKENPGHYTPDCGYCRDTGLVPTQIWGEVHWDPCDCGANFIGNAKQEFLARG